MAPDDLDRTHLDAKDNGCALKVREETKTGHAVATTLYPATQDNVIMQVDATGSFYLDYPQGCLVDAQSGGGDANLPVTVTAGIGDSLTFNPIGLLEITVDPASSVPCDVIMVDAETGGQRTLTVDRVDSRVPFDPPDTSNMFIRVPDTNCVVTAQEATDG